METFITIFEAHLRKWGVYIISMPLFLMALIEALNAVCRKLAVPFPCAIEAVESLLVISVFFGASIVAMERGHVKVDLITINLRRSIRNALSIFGHFLGAAAFGLLTWGAWKMSLYSLEIMEVRLGAYRFPLWPFKLLFAVGLSLFTIQLLINIIKLIHVNLGHTHYADMDKTKEIEPSF